MCLESQLEELPKQVDGVADYIRRVSEIRKNQLTRSNFCLSERYVQGEVIVLVGLSFVGSSGHICNAFALHKRKGYSVEHDRPNAPTFRTELSSDEQTMLVCNVESLEVPEGHIACVSRLYRPEDIFSLGRNALYFSALEGRCVLLGGIADRKLGCRYGRFPIRKNELKSEMVQGATEIMNSISNDETNFSGYRSDRLDKKTNIINFGYRMRLDTNSIGLRFTEESDSRVEITEVLLGTTQL